MPKTILKFLVGSVLLIAAQACAPAPPAPDVNAINTAIAQTMAALTQTAEPGIPVTGQETATPTPTVVTPSPTESLVPTPTITSIPTVTPGGVQISVTVPTNCRVGPGPAYARVGALLVGEVAEVLGRNSAGNWWLIGNPERANQVCWVWDGYATLTGNTGVLPILTPPPLPTPTLTSIPAGTPTGVQISVSVPTNCRVGPGPAYARVGVLRLGEVAQVIGRNAASNWWLIPNPDRGNQVCWVWDGYATLTGNTGAVPILTPPPLSTPARAASFDVFSEGLESCPNIGWWLDINVENLGSVTFRSVAITMRDLDTDITLTQSSNGFIDRSGCNNLATRDTLPPGADRVVSSPVFNYNPTGHRLRATITLCSNPGQSGACVTNTVNFRP